MSIRDKAAIVGIGATDFSKDSGRSELQLAVEAIRDALDDAGLSPADVDGLVTFTYDENIEGEVLRNIGGHELKFFGRVGYGGGATGGVVQQAVMAIATGICDVVVCYRALNERSGVRYGQPTLQENPTAEQLYWSHHSIHGLQTPAAMMSLALQRYIHETGAGPEDFAHIAVGARRHAATNPKAWYFGRPITVDDYLNSRRITDVLRLYDMCMESDGAVAFVLTSAERARDLRQKPALVQAAASAMPVHTHALANYYRDDIIPRVEVEAVAKQLYAQSGLSPKDLQVAILYDHFGPSLLPAIEGFGFCAKGEAKDFIKNGNIEIGGDLPVNTHGGQIGEAYIIGMNGINEAVRQIRGTAVNQVAGVENVLATAGSGTPTSAIILGAA
jgi:acetyl-CoA acetyltransferase